MTVTKAIAAVRIIAGLWDGFDWWATFHAVPRPERNHGEGIIEHRERVARDVKLAACEYVSEQLNVAERIGATLRRRNRGDST